MKRKISVTEVIELESDLALAYDAIKESYESYRVEGELTQSFNEYLIRCGLTATLDAFALKLKTTTVEGHA